MPLDGVAYSSFSPLAGSGAGEGSNLADAGGERKSKSRTARKGPPLWAVRP
jgi:hypothetical protein